MVISLFHKKLIQFFGYKYIIPDIYKMSNNSDYLFIKLSCPLLLLDLQSS